jgi:hypothetical protein
MDIKRVAFETKPVNRSSTPKITNAPVVAAPMPQKRTVSREHIAAIVDKVLGEKIKDIPAVAEPVVPAQPESPVKTVIHELRPQSLTENGVPREPVPFVSENDVRDASEKGVKIYVNAKTIITPSARDLGEERDIFARV